MLAMFAVLSTPLYRNEAYPEHATNGSGKRRPKCVRVDSFDGKFRERCGIPRYVSSNEVRFDS